jgi:cysteinyl-tRNA synthetase
MVKKLDAAEGSEQQSNTAAKKLVKKIKSDFEAHMNDDLQVKAAFDSLYDTVSSLVKLEEQKMLSAEDSKEALAELKAIDYVLQAIF